MYFVYIMMSLRMGVVKSFMCFFCLVNLIHWKMSLTEDGSPAKLEWVRRKREQRGGKEGNRKHSRILALQCEKQRWRDRSTVRLISDIPSIKAHYCVFISTTRCRHEFSSAQAVARCRYLSVNLSFSLQFRMHSCRHLARKFAEAKLSDHEPL